MVAEAPSPSEPIAEDDASLDSDASDAFDAFIDSDDEPEYCLRLLQHPLPSGDAVSSPPPALGLLSQLPLPQTSHCHVGTFTTADSEDQSKAYGFNATRDDCDRSYAELLLDKMCLDALAKISKSSSRMAKKHGNAAQLDV